MGHPSASYIKYLIIKGMAEGQLPDDRARMAARAVPGAKQPTAEDKAYIDFHRYEVDGTLTDYDLPHIADDAFYRIYRKIHVPQYVQLFNTRHTPTAEFMTREGVYSIWKPGPGELAVFDLLQQSFVKETVKILLMGRHSPLEISSRVSKKFGINLPVPAVEMFYTYFWNVNNVGVSEWHWHLQGSYLKDHLMASLTGSPGQALYRAGFNPKIDGQVTLKDLQRTLHYRLEATRMLPDNTDTASIVARLSRELVSIHNVLYGEGAGLEDTLKKFREFRMELKKTDAVSLEELAPQGNFSNSGSGGTVHVKRALTRSRMGENN